MYVQLFHSLDDLFLYRRRTISKQDNPVLTITVVDCALPVLRSVACGRSFVKVETDQLNTPVITLNKQVNVELC